MATIRKRNGRWQVQVRRSFSRATSRTFSLRSDAMKWAAATEYEIEVGGLPIAQKTGASLGDLLQRYESEVLPNKRTDSSEQYMIRIIRRHPMTRKPLDQLSSKDISDFRDKRLQEVRPATVVRQLRVLRHALRIARDEWSWRVPLEEAAKVRMPRVIISPAKRVTDVEISSLLVECEKQRPPVAASVVRLALATAMRRGELLNLMWCDVDLVSKRLLVRAPKNGSPRMIPLSSAAITVLEEIDAHDGPVFLTNVNAIKLAFSRARRRAGTSFRFHDLRHEAISRLFERGLTAPECQLVSGHKTLSQLSRYSHADVDRLAAKLDSADH